MSGRVCIAGKCSGRRHLCVDIKLKGPLAIKILKMEICAMPRGAFEWQKENNTESKSRVEEKEGGSRQTTRQTVNEVVNGSGPWMRLRQVKSGTHYSGNVHIF